MMPFRFIALGLLLIVPLTVFGEELTFTSKNRKVDLLELFTSE